MTHEGSCHCGKVAYTVEGEIDMALECNCSICRRNGYLLWFVPSTSLHVQSHSTLKKYTFNKHMIKHNFCSDCGSSVFGEAKDPKTGTPMAAINIRCLPNVDLKSIKKMEYDGASA